MNNSKIWLSSPHMGGTEEKYVQEAFETNWVAPLGPNVNGLENDLEMYHQFLVRQLLTRIRNRRIGYKLY